MSKWKREDVSDELPWRLDENVKAIFFEELKILFTCYKGFSVYLFRCTK